MCIRDRLLPEAGGRRAAGREHRAPCARAGLGEGTKKGERDRDSGLALETAPTCPLPLGRRSAERRTRRRSRLHQARDSVGHWLASAAATGKPESSGRLLAARTTKAVAARTPAASTRRDAASAAWAAARPGCPGPAAAGRKRRLGATRPGKVSDAACDSFSVRAGRLQRLVADAGSLPGDVQRPCHARARE